MRSFTVRIMINGLALWIASWLLPGLVVATSATTGALAESGVTRGADTLGIVLAYLFVGLIFGAVNSFVRPIARLISLPITILTLGLFTIAINAAMLSLTAWLSTYTPVQFTIDSFFWTAVLASIIISVTSLVVGSLPGARSR